MDGHLFRTPAPQGCLSITVLFWAHISVSFGRTGLDWACCSSDQATIKQDGGGPLGWVGQLVGGWNKWVWTACACRPWSFNSVFMLAVNASRQGAVAEHWTMGRTPLKQRRHLPPSEYMWGIAGFDQRRAWVCSRCLKSAAWCAWSGRRRCGRVMHHSNRCRAAAAQFMLWRKLEAPTAGAAAGHLRTLPWGVLCRAGAAT
jgi:hypothetical protein